MAHHSSSMQLPPLARGRSNQPCALPRRGGACPTTNPVSRPTSAAPVACARRPGDEGDMPPATPHHMSRRAWLLPAAALAAAALLPSSPATAAAPTTTRPVRRPLAETLREQEAQGASTASGRSVSPSEVHDAHPIPPPFHPLLPQPVTTWSAASASSRRSCSVRDKRARRRPG